MRIDCSKCIHNDICEWVDIGVDGSGECGHFDDGALQRYDIINGITPMDDWYLYHSEGTLKLAKVMDGRIYPAVIGEVPPRVIYGPLPPLEGEEE